MKNIRIILLAAVIFGVMFYVFSFGSTGSFPAVLTNAISSADTSSLITVFRMLAVSVVCIILTAGFFTDDFDTIILYVFYRVGTLKKWFLLKTFSLFVHIVEYYLAVMGVFTVLFSVSVKELRMREIFSLPTLFIFLILTLSTFSGALMVNVFSLVTESKWAVTAYLLIMGLCSVITGLIKETVILYVLNPIYNFFITWHAKAAWLPQFYDREVGSDTVFTLGFSVVYFLVIVLIFIGIGLYMINKEELCLRKKD